MPSESRLPKTSSDQTLLTEWLKREARSTTLNKENRRFWEFLEALIPWEQPKSLATLQFTQASFSKPHCYQKITPTFLVILETDKNSYSTVVRHFLE